FGSGSRSVVAGDRAVAIGDLDADGRPDLAAAGGTGVSILLGNGHGTFGGGTTYPASYTRTLTLADLNADGRLDVVAASGSGLAVLLGDGPHSFEPMSYYDTGDAVSCVSIGDLNADARPDVAVAKAENVSVMLGNGDGTFGPRTDLAGNTELEIANLNEDGRADLVASE